VLAALYKAPERTVVAEVDEPQDDERLVTEIWMQQWPRLRRGFGFCTLAGMDRSSKGVALDLQLVRAPDRQARSKFPNSVTPAEMVSDPALEPLVADLEGADGTQIREFLRRTGGDVDGGRRAMLPLCRLYSSLFSQNPPDLLAAVTSLRELDALGTRQARSVRSIVARNAIDQVDVIEDEVFDFVVDTLEQGLRPNEKPIVVDRLGVALWRRSPTRFRQAIETGGVIGEASLKALPLLSGTEIIDGLRHHPALAAWIASARPDLLENADFWGLAEIDDDIAAEVVAADASKVAIALMEAGRFGSAGAIIGRAAPDAIAAALSRDVAEPVLVAWVKAVIAQPDKAAAVLASGKIQSRSVICTLARAGEPDLVPNDYGDDPWLIALRGSRGVLSQNGEDFLAAFMMARALGHRSRSQAELIRFAYTTLYRAMQQDRLPVDVQRLVTSRFDWGGWFSWDNCARLKETVVARFVDRQLDPETFGRLTDDGALAISLIDEAARSGRGRRFLEDVRKRLKHAKEKGIRARADHIERKTK